MRDQTQNRERSERPALHLPPSGCCRTTDPLASATTDVPGRPAADGDRSPDRTSVSRADRRRSRQRVSDQRGASSLEMVLILPFVVMTFLILVGLGYVLATKQHALVAARYAATYRVAKGSDPSPPSVAHAAFVGVEEWTTTIDVDNPPSFVPFLSGFDSSGTATSSAGSIPERGIVPKLYPTIPAAKAKFVITTTTSTCREIGASSYLTFILNQGGVGDILGTDDEDCCDCYTAD